MSNYQDFISAKTKKFQSSGFSVNDNALNNNLFPFQVYSVHQTLRAGRHALFADCGLGKTIMQLSWAEQVSLFCNRPVLILCPLVVADQTVSESQKFAIANVVRWSKSIIIPPIGVGIYVAHYEQLDSIDANLFAGIVLDESSILKNFEGKTRNQLIDTFANTPYKLCCTATPSPNDPMELGNHAEFLNVMTRNQMLAMYFVHDGGDTGKWRIKGHCEDMFWEWVSSWAIMMGKPQDIGFNMDGYELPPLNAIERAIKTQKRDNGQLFNDLAITATSYNSELRLTKVERIDEVASIVNASNECFIVWVRQNEESSAVLKLIPDAVEVSGSMSQDMKVERLGGFAKGNFRVLVTKPEICAYGLNYQHCANHVFAAPDFSFEKVYQAIRRSYRFGQKRSVNVFFVTTDTMKNVRAKFLQKQSAFKIMQEKMSLAMNRKRNNSDTKNAKQKQPLQIPVWLKSLSYASL